MSASAECETTSVSASTEAVPISGQRDTCHNEEEVVQPVVSSSVRAAKSTAMPFAAALAALGVAIIGGVVTAVLKRTVKKKSASSAAPVEVPTPSAAEPMATTAPVPHPNGMAVDLSPFGSPVGNTPVRLPPVHKQDKMRGRAAMADSDADDQSDNASVRDQRQNLVDASQLQKTLKQMQEMADENRKLSAFLVEYKADAEKLSRLEEENRALRDVTRQLEVELQELKTSTMPRTGAELEVFKNSVRVPTIARSVCSNDPTIDLGVSTASVDGAHPETRVRRTNVFKQLLATLQGTASTGTSQPVTPRGSIAGATPRGGSTAGNTRQRRQPGPEEAAVIGQAVYQLLDQFGGRMM